MTSRICAIATLVLSLATVFLPACAKAPTSATQTAANPDPTEQRDADSAPFDLEGLLARELKPLGTMSFGPSDGAWTASVETVAEPTIAVNEEGVGTVAIDLGTESSMSCFVFNTPIDIGGTVENFFKLSAQNVTYSKILTKFSGLAGRHPMMIVEGLYTVVQDGQKMAGQVKFGILSHPVRPVYCTFDEVGYTESFSRIVKGLFTTYKTEKKAGFHYAEVWRAEMAGRPLGFSVLRVTKNEDNTWTSRNQSTLLLPRSPVDLLATDELTIATSDAKGFVTSKKSIAVMAGELSTNIDIKRTQKKKYAYQGIFQGKQLEGTFKTKKKGLLDEFRVTQKVRKILNNKANKTFNLESYNAQVDPTRAVEIKYETQGQNDPQTVLIHLGQITMTGTADKEGYMEKLAVPLGAAEMQLIRVHVEGTPPGHK